MACENDPDALTVNPLGFVAVPSAPVTDTSLVPKVAAPVIEILAVIWLELFTVKLLTVIPEPKLTAVAPLKLLPVMMTLLKVCPCVPWLGLTEVMVGGIVAGCSR